MTGRTELPLARARAGILTATGLHAFYGQSHILRGVSLHIHHGETVALMGRNGMGKSTLIRTIMGLVPAAEGRIALAGVDATGLPTFARARLGVAYVPEGRGVFGTLTVAENLDIAARAGPDGGAAWTIPRVLELFPRLAERRTNRGDQLSGGEQQMLAIARALLTNPRLIILDEATEGLAPLIREEIWATIRLLRETGLAALIVDKSVSELASVADRVVVLVKGEVVHEGPPATLLADEALMHRHLGV
ncbi:MAG: ABC transporter ATP-binding protein [Hyphomicrobiaceae bacterium]